MSRGGKRPGSGRKKMASEGKRRTYTITVAPETVDRLHELRKRGIIVSRLFDDLVLQLYLKSHLEI